MVRFPDPGVSRGCTPAVALRRMHSCGLLAVVRFPRKTGFRLTAAGPYFRGPQDLCPANRVFFLGKPVFSEENRSFPRKHPAVARGQSAELNSGGLVAGRVPGGRPFGGSQPHSGPGQFVTLHLLGGKPVSQDPPLVWGGKLWNSGGDSGSSAAFL